MPFLLKLLPAALQFGEPSFAESTITLALAKMARHNFLRQRWQFSVFASQNVLREPELTCARAGGHCQHWGSTGRKPAAAFQLLGHRVRIARHRLVSPAAAESVGLPCARKSSALHLISISAGIALLQSLDMKSIIQEVQQGRELKTSQEMEGGDRRNHIH